MMQVRTLITLALLGPATVPAQTWSVFPQSGASGSVFMTGSPGGLLVHGLGAAFEYDGAAWNAIPTPAPSRRTLAMAFDSIRQRTVLFGGVGVAGGLHGDTWEWDGASWTHVAVAGPSARAGAAMCFHSQLQVAVLFGGATSTGFSNETWVFDGVTWQRRFGAAPSIRADAAMAFDRVRNAVVLFGGGVPGVPNGALNDTWEWNGSQWTRRSAAGPSPRLQARLAWDPHSDRVLMFGGWDGASASAGWFDDALSWNGTDWTPRNFAMRPSARGFHGMAHNPLTDEIVVVAGSNASSFDLTDAWVYPGRIAADATPYGGGCGGLSLVSTAAPIMGQAAISEVRRPVPFAAAFMAIGFDRNLWGTEPLPFALAGFGMPGCTLYHDASLILFGPCPVTAPGVATHTFPIPVIPAISGLEFYLQSWVPDPAANAGGLITSNALALTIGNF
ncbi:MAG: hypothetical protein NXI31_27145 [bacterium]|nr:hypothetical protein [bacterium]